MPPGDDQHLDNHPAPATTLPVVQEKDATGEVAAVYDNYRSHFGRSTVPGILQCFATHPPLLRHMLELSKSLLFEDGSLGRRQKEMIATLISSQNQCPYCADSHGYFLRLHGGSSETLDALQRNELSSPSLTPSEQLLLSFAEKVNCNASAIGKEDAAALLQAGWSHQQIAEAVHITALFATFNRVANAFGLPSQNLLKSFQSSPEPAP